MDDERGSWVVVFDCGEAAIVERRTRSEARQVRDPLNCLPVAVYPLAACRLRREPWMKDGMLRCELDRVVIEPADRR